MDRTKILLATRNPAKQRTLRWLLEGLPLDLKTDGELGLADETPAEEGSSHEENARIKAEWYSEAAGTLAIASDGGMVIPALGNRWRSLFTHRFAGDDANDEARLERLIDLMRPYGGDDRREWWVEALAIADAGRIMASWQVEGATGLLLNHRPGPAPILPGFWVFTVWYFASFGKTYNQLDEREREALDDHWSGLKPLVQRFFRERTGSDG